MLPSIGELDLLLLYLLHGRVAEGAPLGPRGLLAEIRAGGNAEVPSQLAQERAADFVARGAGLPLARLRGRGHTQTGSTHGLEERFSNCMYVQR